MKLTVTLKDPDGFYESVLDAVKDSLSGSGLDDDEMESAVETRMDKVWTKLSKFVEYKEYIDIEFDTDAGTARVVERK